MNFKTFPDTEKINFDKSLKVKFGIDPTSDKLHLGHLIPLLKAKELWEKGHHIDIVLGTFTAQLGDPSGKDTMRPILSAAETKRNAESIEKQVCRLFGSDNTDIERLEFHSNSDWFHRMTSIEMIGILSKFTSTQLLARDSFQKRIAEENPIGMHELVVPVLQGYDSVALKTDVEIGGTDQMFNFAITRDVQRIFDQSPEVCILAPIINGTDGRKMSKSFKNCIFLNDASEDVYGKVMSISDALMQEWWPVFFDVEIINMNFPMEQKKKLAFQVTSKIWSFDQACNAEEHFQSVIQKKNVPENMMEISAESNKDLTIIDAVSKIRNCSKTQARQLLSEGAVSVDGVKVGIDFQVLIAGATIKVGKKDFAKII